LLKLSIISAEDICGYKPQAEITVQSSSGKKISFAVGIANTPQTYEKGLMNCEKLKEGTGLFFIFEFDRIQAFWMKNTTIPLAIVYIDNNFNVVSVGKGIPLNTKTIPSMKPARYVLEVNWEEGKDIKQGDKVLFKMK